MVPIKHALPIKSAMVWKSAFTSASGFSLPPEVTDITISNAINTPIRLSPTISPDANKTPRWLHDSKSCSSCPGLLVAALCF